MTMTCGPSIPQAERFFSAHAGPQRRPGILSRGSAHPFALSLSKGPIILSLSKDLSRDRACRGPVRRRVVPEARMAFDKLSPTLRQARGERVFFATAGFLQD